jgi:hypothetical protein
MFASDPGRSAAYGNATAIEAGNPVSTYASYFHDLGNDPCPAFSN